MTNQQTDPKGADRPGDWHVRDFVDFEIFLAQDERAPDGEKLAQRDRSLFTEFTAADIVPSRSQLFLAWVQKRRTESGDEPSAGEQVESFLAWAAVALAILGFILARALVWSFFRAVETAGTRPEPVNVFWYLLVSAGLPLLFTLYGFWLLFIQRNSFSLPRAPSFIRGLLLDLLKRPLTRVSQKLRDLTGPEKRLAAEAAWGSFRRRAMDNGAPISFKFICIAQLLGLSFSLGILLFSALDCLFYSRVFGWQSTAAAVRPETAFHIVRVIAAPWSWAASEGTGFPSLEQVAATRFVRYQDPASFPVPAASAWANFLVAAVFVYTFLPRALLYFFSRWQLRRALSSPNFAQARYDRLWERLTLPHVTIRSIGDVESLPPNIPHSSGTETPARPLDCILLIPEELLTAEREQAITTWLSTRKGWNVARTLPLNGDSAAQLETVGRAVLIHESFMPPVKSILKLIKHLRTAAPKTGLAVALIGKPSNEPLGAPPSRTDFDVWNARVLSLGDSNIDFFSFREPQL